MDGDVGPQTSKGCDFVYRASRSKKKSKETRWGEENERVKKGGIVKKAPGVWREGKGYKGLKGRKVANAGGGGKGARGGGAGGRGGREGMRGRGGVRGNKTPFRR